MTLKKQLRFRSEVKKGLFRIPLTITREMESWLRTLSDEMKATGGYKLPKSYILRSLINAAMKLNIDVSGVKSEADLEKRFEDAIRQYKGGD
jgi:hypothetical protein